MSFIARQPNGLLCRFSTIVDTVTHYNMTDEEYIEMCAQKAKEEAVKTLESSLQAFKQVKESFIPVNMTRREFNKLLRLMEAEVSNQ